MNQIVNAALNRRPMSGRRFSIQNMFATVLTGRSIDGDKFSPKEVFDAANRKKINTCDRYMEVLESTQNHKSKNVKKKVDGIIKKLNQEEKDTGKIQTHQNDQHIFISYHKDSMATILKVMDHLQKKGFNLSVDEKDMSRSRLESKAMAVENASVVLVCYSEKYKDSSNCKKEGEYAFRLNKPIIPLRLQESYVPVGWLGMLIGSKYVHDVSKPNMFEKSMKSLIETLDNLNIIRSMKQNFLNDYDENREVDDDKEDDDDDDDDNAAFAAIVIAAAAAAAAIVDDDDDSDDDSDDHHLFKSDDDDDDDDE